jgi:hypothetical protein
MKIRQKRKSGMDIKIVVATHKAYRMPDDPMYMPLQTGCVDLPRIGFAGDDSGDNISAKNCSYCEMTGLYWAWKNLDADALGLVHYRRHFTMLNAPAYMLSDKWAHILTREQAYKLLDQYDVLLPRRRRYYIENNYSHFVHAHRSEGLDMAGEYIRSQSEEYKAAWETVCRRTWAHMFNLFLMKRPLVDAYCEWVFDVLAHVERRLDISGYSEEEARVFGRIGELMLDVWLEANGITYKEIGMMFMERQNWVKKATLFLARKVSRGKLLSIK